MNAFFIKKILGLFLMGLFPPAILILILLLTKNILYALFGCIACVSVLFVLVNWVLIRHPFLKIIEGGGIGVLTLDSTGIISCFIAKKNNAYVQAKIGGKKIESVFDRNIVHYLAFPKKATVETQFNKNNEEFLTFRVKKEDYQKSIFSFQGLPIFIYNTVQNTFLTKESLMLLEDKLLAHHLLKYLVVKVEELTGWLRDFSRYIVEQLRPKSGLLQSKWFWILIIGTAFILMIVLFGPKVYEIFMKSGSSLVPDTSAIVPRK